MRTIRKVEIEYAKVRTYYCVQICETQPNQYNHSSIWIFRYLWMAKAFKWYHSKRGKWTSKICKVKYR